MATRDDVRRLALALPEARESPDHFAFDVRGKGFAWVWMERTTPKRPKVPNPEVLAIRVGGLGAKEMLAAAMGRALVDDPHYAGYPAVLVRLSEVSRWRSWRIC